MHDGPEDAPRRSRRTRTDDAPPLTGETATGNGDDVLGRYGLRDVDGSRDDGPARRHRDDDPPWPPRARRRGSPVPDAPAPESADRGPDDRARGSRRRVRNGRAAADRPGGTDRSQPDGHGRDPEDASGRDPVAARTDALPSVPAERQEAAAASGRPGRRRRGAADSRHTQVMPITPRRRTRDDAPDPQGDEPPTGERPAVPPRTAGAPPPPPAGAPRPAAPPSGTPRTAPPSEVTPPLAGPDANAPSGAPRPGTRRADAPVTASRATPPAEPQAPGRRPDREDGSARPPTGRTAAARPQRTAERPAEPQASAARTATVPPEVGAPEPARSSAGAPPDPPRSSAAAPPDPARSSAVAPPDPARSSPAAPPEPGRSSPALAPDDPDAEADAAPAREDRGAPGSPTRRRPGRRPPTRGDDDPPPPPAGPGRRLLRIGAVLVAVVVFAACASGFASRETVEGGIRTVAALDPGSDAISSRATQAGDENVLVLGLPAGRSGVPEAARADTAVLVHLPANGAPAVTLGFPATLEVARPPCQRWDAATGTYGDTVPAESRTALSSAYDVGGPKCAVGVAQQVTGLVVTRFVAVDLTGVNTLVDSVRGVGVCTERPVVDRALGPVVTRPGDTVLGGTEADRFAAATGVADTSPIDRVRRQQRVLSAVLEDALSTTSLLSPGASDRVARALPGTLTVDGAEAGDLLVLSRSLSRTTGEDAAPPYVSVPVNELPNTRGHLELNRNDSSDLFSALQKHEPLPPEFTVPAQRAGTPLLPQGTVVDVRNAAGRSGLADEIATALRAQGYVIGAVGDAPPTPDTTIRFSPDRADASGVLAGSVPGARAEADPAATGTLQLVLGSSFPGAAAMGAPTTAGPSADCG